MGSLHEKEKNVITDDIDVDFTGRRKNVNAVDMRKRKYHHGDLREALLGAAESLIGKHGAAGFSLRECARAVGVDPAACYRHFRDKDDVLNALARRGFTKLAKKMEAVVARRKGKVALRALGEAYVDFAMENEPQFRVMFGPAGYLPRDPRARGDYERGGYDILLDTVRAWRKSGTDDDDDEAVAMAMWSGVHGAACLLVDGPIPKKERARVMDALFDRLLS